MPRVKKQEHEPVPEPEYDGQYLTDNEEELEPPVKGKKQTPKRKYRKRTPSAAVGKGKKAEKTKKATAKKAKKQTPTKLTDPTQNKQYQSNLLNSATKMKRMLNINKARLNAVTRDEDNEEDEYVKQQPVMRPMNSTLDFSKVHFIPKGLLNSVKSAKAKSRGKGKKGKKYTKRVKLPKSIMDKIKEAQQAMKDAKQSTVLPGYKLGKCPKCGKVHMLPGAVANEVSGYESDNEGANNYNNNYNNYNNNQPLHQQQPEEHYRKTGLVYTSTTTNGKTTDMGRYVIDNSNNNAVVKGVIKDGKRIETRIPRM
jgi:hypothetical protein